MSRPHSLIHGTLLLTAASLALRGSGMCFQIYLSNRLGAAGVGLLQLISTVGLFAMTVGTAGVRVAAMYLTAEEYGARRPGGMRKALFCCLAYGALASSAGGFVLVQAAGWISDNWIGDARAALSLRVLGWTMPLNCLWAVLAGYLTACSRLRQLVTVEFIDQAVSIAATAFLLVSWAGSDLEYACASIHLANGFATAVTLLLLLRAALHGWGKTSGPAGGSMWGRLLRLCLPLAVNDALRSGLSATEQLIIPKGLQKFDGSSEGAMAAYGVIHGMVFPVLMFPVVLLASLSDLLVPELARCRAAMDSQRIRSLSNRCLRFGLLYAAAVSGLCWCIAGPLGELLYHNSLAGVYLRRFAPMVLILYLDAIVDGMHKGLGQQVYCVRVNTLTNLLDVTFLWLLLPRFGVAGFFFTFTFTHILNFFLSLIRLMNVAECSSPLAFAAKVLACTAGAALGVEWLLRLPLGTAAACVLGGVAFLAGFALLVLLCGAFGPEDRRWIRMTLGIDLQKPQREPKRCAERK